MPSNLLIAAGAALWLALTRRLYTRRAWLAYYITGAFGFTVLTLFISQALGIDARLEALEARQVAFLGPLVGVDLTVMGGSGLAIANPLGWTIFDIGIECSALLEMAVFNGLIAFYPAYDAALKWKAILIGSVATYVSNLLRILLIAAIVAHFGGSWTFMAHAVFGRLAFFILTVAVYWYLFTRPTIRVVADSLPEARRG